VLRDPFRYKKQAANNVTFRWGGVLKPNRLPCVICNLYPRDSYVRLSVCFLRVFSVYFFNSKKNGQVGRSLSLVRSDSVRSPEPEDEDVRREKEKLLNRNETSIEESSLSVVIRVS